MYKEKRVKALKKQKIYISLLATCLQRAEPTHCIAPGIGYLSQPNALVIMSLS